MLNLPKINEALVGGAIALSTVAFGAATAEAAVRAPVENTNVTRVDASADRFSGQLEGLKAPLHNVPVAWRPSMSRTENVRDALLLCGALGATAGAIAYPLSTFSRHATFDVKEFLGTTLVATVGMGALGSLFGFASAPARVIEFNTTIASVVQDQAKFTEIYSDGCVGESEGQLLTIPETNLVLAARTDPGQFTVGQKIKVRVAVGGGNRITAWHASPLSGSRR